MSWHSQGGVAAKIKHQFSVVQTKFPQSGNEDSIKQKRSFCAVEIKFWQGCKAAVSPRRAAHFVFRTR